MSFICEHTGEVVAPGIPEHKVVIQTRSTTYTNQVYKRGKPSKDVRIDQGEEIVKEIRVSPDAYKALTGLEPRRLPVPPKPTYSSRKKESRPVKPWRNPKNKGKNTKNNQTAERKKPVVHVVKKFTKPQPTTPSEA